MDRTVVELVGVECRSVGIRRLNRRRREEEEEEEGCRSRDGCRSRGCYYYCWTPWNGLRRTHAARELLGDVSGIGWTSKDAGFKLRAANILIAWNEISPVVLQSYSTVQSCGLGRFNGYFPPIISGGVG